MTDRIDLDDRDAAGASTDEAESADESNEGDWLWRDEGAPAPDPAETGGRDDGDEAAVPDEAGGTDGSDGSDGSSRRVPHVPHDDKNKPVGVPAAGGGAGGASAFEDGDGDAGAPARAWGGDDEAEAAGPHGGGADDMTMAITYRAIRRLENPSAVFADAATWTDWIGIVGDVDAPVVNKFQRERGIDVDFFNGTGTGPAERLASIDGRSMFYADRMVVVGIEGEDDPVAEAAGWEFVPLREAAAEADWDLAG